MGTPLTAEQFHRLDQRIRVMTTLLWKIPVIEATSHSDRSPRANICQHLATVFSTSNPGDRDEVVAVTGMQTPEMALSTVLLTRNPEWNKEGQERSLLVQELRPAERDVDIILQDRSSHTFRSHIEDWMKLVSEQTLSQDERRTKYDLVRFTVYRNRLRIAQRLENGRRIWMTHPIDTLAEFLTKDLPSGTITLLTPIDVVIPVTSPDIRDIGNIPKLNLKDATESTDWKRIPFNASTAIHWLRILVRTYKTFEGVFKLLQLDKPALPERGKSWKIQWFHQCTTALGAMRDLLAIKLPGSGDRLFSVLLNAMSSFKPLLLHKEHSIFQLAPQPKEISEEEEEEVTSGSVSDDQVPDTTAGDARDVLGKADDPPGEQVFRYLRTIPAHLTSIRVVMERLGRQPLPPRVNLLEYPKPQQTLAKTYVHEIINEVLGQFTELDKESARDFLDKRRTKGGRLNENNFRGTVHAEAALMGLAVSKYARLQDPAQSLDPFQLLPNSNSAARQLLDDCLPDMGQVSIGVTKNCCSTCEFFRRCIETQFLDHTSPQPSERVPLLHFDLPGSHGLSFPWALPEIGVTKEVAEALEEELMERLVHFVRLNLEYAVAARQSSEGSDDDEDDRPDEEMKPFDDFAEPLPITIE